MTSFFTYSLSRKVGLSHDASNSSSCFYELAVWGWWGIAKRIIILDAQCLLDMNCIMLL